MGGALPASSPAPQERPRGRRFLVLGWQRSPPRPWWAVPRWGTTSGQGQKVGKNAGEPRFKMGNELAGASRQSTAAARARIQAGDPGRSSWGTYRSSGPDQEDRGVAFATVNAPSTGARSRLSARAASGQAVRASTDRKTSSRGGYLRC